MSKCLPFHPVPRGIRNFPAKHYFRQLEIMMANIKCNFYDNETVVDDDEQPDDDEIGNIGDIDENDEYITLDINNSLETELDDSNNDKNIKVLKLDNNLDENNLDNNLDENNNLNDNLNDNLDDVNVNLDENINLNDNLKNNCQEINVGEVLEFKYKDSELKKEVLSSDSKTISINLGEETNISGEPIDFRKLQLPKLRSIAVEKGLVLNTEALKLKKHELLKLLGVE